MSPNLEMAGSNSKPKTPAETKQEKAKEAYKARFDKTVVSVEENLAIYNTSLTDNSFEDKEDENTGEGEKRKKAMQAKITSLMDRAERMKAVLDSGENIPSTQEEIQADYTYVNPETQKVERQETITINIEEKLQKFTEFYGEMGISLPSNFEEEIKEIWERNAEEIQSTMEEKGFDDILIVPADLDIGELSEKLKMENGYYDWIKTNGTTVANLKGIPLTSTGTNKPRIILIHKTQNFADRPELKATLGVKAQDVNLEESLSLEDYIIFQRTYFKETGKHLDIDGWTWTPRTKSGSRFVNSCWLSDDGRLGVGADDAGDSYSLLGCRPSRYFV